jgi:UDP-4-amino-4-deoxy-L-arabinose formyltransferase/UDP-glucuronic acid dehydrogenase (UDP-4-keto-hexauronic acid decarboxylating)
MADGRPPRTPLRVALAAEGAAGSHVLRLLDQSEHELVLVAASDEGGSLSGVRRLAQSLDVPVVDSGELREPGFAERIRAASVDLLLNVYSLHLLPAEVVAAPTIGSFNLHPGPLPEYAGLNVASWAIYRGERSHAVTLHRMDEGIDTGPVAYASTFPIEPDDTGLALGLKCIRHGLPLVRALLAAAAGDPAAIPRLEQRPGARRYFGREGPPADVAWSRPARQIVDHVRACDYRPFPGPWPLPATRARGAQVELVAAARSGEPSAVDPGTVGKVDDGGAWIAAGDEWVVVTAARLDGRAVEPAQVFHTADRCEPLVSTAGPAGVGGR